MVVDLPAVGPEQAERLPGGDLEVDVVVGDDVVVGLAQPARHDHRSDHDGHRSRIGSESHSREHPAPVGAGRPLAVHCPKLPVA
jgi:hypothetical protein